MTESHQCVACSSIEVVPLDFINRTAAVIYQRCLACGHVWTVAKNGEPGSARDVTYRDTGAERLRH